MERLCKEMENKFCNILSYLTQLSCEFEMIADEIDNENLKSALRAVATEANQYAMELNARTGNFLLAPAPPATNKPGDETQEKRMPGPSNEKGEELLSIFESCESFLSQSYADVLAGHLTDTLKNVIYCQFVGIKFAFMRIKFLNSQRFDNSLYFKPA